jgi:hypothetical protein
MPTYGSSGSSGDGMPVGYGHMLPIGTAVFGDCDVPMGEAAQREYYYNSSEFGLPVGYVDPCQYHGKTPEQAPSVHVSRDSRF